MKNIFIGCIFFSICCYSFAQVSDPKQINGLKLWLAADSSIVLSSGSSVSQWTDLSGSSNNAIQTTLANQPTLIPGILNSFPVISFDGNNNFMLTPTGLLDNFSALSIFAVIKLKLNTNQPANDQNGGIFASDLAFSNLELTSQTNGSIRIRNNNDAINIVNTDLLTIDNWIIMSVVSINASGKAWKNGTNVTNNSTGAQLPIASGIQQALGRYASSYGNYYAKFDIAEFIIYDSALTLTQRQNIENYLHNKYAPPVNLGVDTTITNNFCNITLDAKSIYTSYLWSTGATTQTISVNKTGNYWVQTTDVFGLTSRDTISVTYPDGSYQGNHYLCAGTSKVWNTLLAKNKFTFNWQDSSTDSLFTITTPGTYSVTVTDMFACSTSYSLTVAGDNFPLTASLGNDTTLCSGNLIYLKTSAHAAASYLWSNGTTNDSLAIFLTGQYSVTVTDTNSCIKKDTVNIIIAGIAPTASFLFDTVCFSNANHFIDLSSPLPSSNSIALRHWDFGDLNTLDTTATNFAHTYADTGLYSVKLTITTDVGCSAEKTQYIHVYPYPVVNYTATNLCENATVSFGGTATTFSYPITQWNWNFGDPGSGTNNMATSQNSTHNFGVYGSYNVKLIAKNSYGCADTSVNNLSVKASPSANFGYSLACVNDVVQFTDYTPITPLFNIQNYYWNFGDISTSALQNPIHAFSNNTTYTIKYIVTASNGCIDSMTVPLAIHPKPAAAFTYSNACVNSSTGFSDNSTIATGAINTRKWNFGDNTTSTIQNPQHTYTDTISARVKLVVTSNYGCKDSLTKTVYIRSSPIADFSVNPPYGSPPLQVAFTNNSTGATSYLWDLTDTVTTANSPQYTFTSIGSYSITLTASTNFGCTSTKSKTIEISKEYVDVAIKNLTADIQDNFLNISAQLLNNSSMDITSMDLIIKTSGIAEIKEKWTGLLIKGGLMLYTFPTSMYTDNDEHFVCVTIENPNGLQDDVPDNNTSCNAVDATTFQILPIYPNPTTDKLNVPLVIPEVGNTMNITLFNMQGKQIQQIYSGNINKGLQLLTIDLVGIASGMYSLKFEYKGQTIVKKFVKN